MEKQLIISIGTGRCGSVSLSKFLSAQKHTNVIHEGRIDSEKIRKLIKWKNDDVELFKWLEYLISYDKNKFIGDTGMYFLPYIDKIIQKYPRVKIIVMIRDMDQVVKSYLKKTEGRNHWNDHNGIGWDLDEKWDPCYPTYQISNKEEALKKYWQDYKKETESLELKFPDNLKIWTINDLNTSNGKNEILDFINFNLERELNQEFKHNTNLKTRKESIINKIKKWF
jgi:hypothetical protein